jgi:hypothetical protein
MVTVNFCRPFHLDKCHHLVAACGDALLASGGRLILTRRHSKVVDGKRMFGSSLAVTRQV